MTEQARVYLALGDSMSIDFYTGVEGGGAVNQFHRWLGNTWQLDDRTADGCRMPHVPTDARGELITLTIGGNDLLWKAQEYLARGVGGFAREHLALLLAIRRTNPASPLLVGDVYQPQGGFSEVELQGLAAANAVIRENCQQVGAHLVGIHDAFRGCQDELLCLDIEPTLEGATVIAELFRTAYRACGIE